MTKEDEIKALAKKLSEFIFYADDTEEAARVAYEHFQPQLAAKDKEIEELKENLNDCLQIIATDQEIENDLKEQLRDCRQSNPLLNP